LPLTVVSVKALFTLYTGECAYIVTEAEKVALVAKIQWDQKIMEKESERKMAEIEGMFIFYSLL